MGNSGGRGRQFEIEIEKGDNKRPLGLNVKPSADGKVLNIDGVDEGNGTLVGEHNLQHRPEFDVRTGDKITEVNGIAGNAEVMKQTLKEGSVLAITILSGPAPPVKDQAPPSQQTPQSASWQNVPGQSPWQSVPGQSAPNMQTASGHQNIPGQNAHATQSASGWNNVPGQSGSGWNNFPGQGDTPMQPGAGSQNMPGQNAAGQSAPGYAPAWPPTASPLPTAPSMPPYNSTPSPQPSGTKETQATSSKGSKKSTKSKKDKQKNDPPGSSWFSSLFSQGNEQELQQTPGQKEKTELPNFGPPSQTAYMDVYLDRYTDKHFRWNGMKSEDRMAMGGRREWSKDPFYMYRPAEDQAVLTKDPFEEWRPSPHLQLSAPPFVPPGMERPNTAPPQQMPPGTAPNVQPPGMAPNMQAQRPFGKERLLHGPPMRAGRAANAPVVQGDAFDPTRIPITDRLDHLQREKNSLPDTLLVSPKIPQSQLSLFDRLGTSGQPAAHVVPSSSGRLLPSGYQHSAYHSSSPQAMPPPRIYYEPLDPTRVHSVNSLDYSYRSYDSMVY